MALQDANQRGFRSEQNGLCIQQVTDAPSTFADVFADKVPALLARKSRGPQLKESIRICGVAFLYGRCCLPVRSFCHGYPTDPYALLGTSRGADRHQGRYHDTA